MHSLSALKLALLVPVLVMASTLPSLSTWSRSIADASASSSCRILLLDTGSAWASESLDAIGVSYQELSPSAFLTTQLASYDLLYIPSTFRDQSVTVPAQDALDALNSRSADIASYVTAGGGLVALSEPIGTGNYTWLPMQATPSPVRHREDVEIGAAHPINDGLSSALLSNWGTSSHHYFSSFDTRFSVLASNGDGKPVSLAANTGLGRVFITGQDPDFHSVEPSGSSPVDPGARMLLANAISWASGCPPRYELPYHETETPNVSWTLALKGVHHWCADTPGKPCSGSDEYERSALDFVPSKAGTGPDSGQMECNGDSRKVFPYAWVYPVAGGRVVSFNPYGSGGDFSDNAYIEIEHAPGIRTAYFHLDPAPPPDGKAKWEIGQIVTTATPLGHPSCHVSTKFGGAADLAHVHFAIRRQTGAQDWQGVWTKIAAESPGAQAPIRLCGWSPVYFGGHNGLQSPTGTFHEAAVLEQVAITCGDNPSGGVIQSVTQQLSQGSVSRLGFLIDLAQRWITFFLRYPNSEMLLGLESPSGTLDLSTVCTVYERGAGFDLCRIEAPETGAWTAIVTGVDVPQPEDATVELLAPRCDDPSTPDAGDPCNPDDDGDAIADTVDNCPLIYNPDQTDSNANGVGNACEEAAPAAVGGIADLPDTTAWARTMAESSRGSPTPYAPIAGAAAGGVLLLAVGMWAARRRWHAR